MKILSLILEKVKPVHVTALIVGIVSCLVIVSYKWANPNKEAERHFIEQENFIAYRVMEACYIVILTAAVLNLRYVVVEIAKEIIYTAGPPLLSMAKSKMAAR